MQELDGKRTMTQTILENITVRRGDDMRALAQQDNAKPNGLAQIVAPDSFVWQYVFPDGELVPLHDALMFAAGAGFETRDVESWREHYARTLRHWVARLEVQRDAARRVVDERTYRVWQLYLAAAAHAFDTARVSVYQTLLARRDAQGVSDLPLTREDWYR